MCTEWKSSTTVVVEQEWRKSHAIQTHADDNYFDEPSYFMKKTSLKIGLPNMIAHYLRAQTR
jgi:hypothetical protein